MINPNILTLGEWDLKLGFILAQVLNSYDIPVIFLDVPDLHFLVFSVYYLDCWLFECEG